MVSISFSFFSSCFPINSFLLFTSLLSAALIDAATITVTNNCSFTVWAAATPGGGQQLKQSQTWTLNPPENTTRGRIWARTGCNFNESGYGSCQTGDCNGLLECQTYGSPPNTLAEYALNQNNNLDFFDISLIYGFNVPMQFSSNSKLCTTDIQCIGDINEQCPGSLQAPGGCNNPCTVYNTNEYCCNSSSCEPTRYSRFFKDKCPDAYSYPKDDQTSTFTCPGGTNYKVVFCPTGSVLTNTITRNTTTTVSICQSNSTIIIPQAKITIVAPAFKSCNKQFYVSLSKQ
ncbi:thaumatin-like protein 1 [Impatiens glandulifera]|uniref:thaumatin-like protein 1 n=1 Tax=Impatiens glandulifera TaxID=253017 RepID=UPI001FB0E9D9|nr:thaumatin-like protein 1 [Impatiens glandulifera]